MTAQGFGFGYGWTFHDVDDMTAEERAFCYALPHGSGIDYNWEWYRDDDGQLVVGNSYHGMDEYGGYIESAPFTVTVHDVSSLDFTVTSEIPEGLEAEGCYWDLDDYLGETIHNAVSYEREHNDAV